MATWQWDLITDRVYWNDRHFELLGMTPREGAIPAATFISRVVEEDRSRIVDILSEAIRANARFDAEFRILRDDGVERWMLGHGRVTAFDPLSRPIQMSGVMEDVTPRKAIEESLRWQSEHQRFMLDMADAIRDIEDPISIQALVLERLGKKMDLDRAYYVETALDRDQAIVEREYLRTSAPSIVGVYSLESFGWIIPHLQRGETVVVDDVRSSSLIPEADRDAMEVVQIGSHISVPVIKSRELVGALCVTQVASRAWSRYEVELVSECADRLWAAIQSARSQSALRQREVELARVQEFGAIGGVEIDIAHGLTGRRSPEYLRIHGLSADARSETHDQWLQRVHPEDRASAEAVLKAALEGHAREYVNTYRIIRPRDGQVRWIHAKAEIERDTAGKAVRLVGAHLDITDRMEIEEALRQSQEEMAQKTHLFDITLASLPDHIYAFDREGRYAFVNPALL